MRHSLGRRQYVAAFRACFTPPLREWHGELSAITLPVYAILVYVSLNIKSITYTSQPVS